MTFYDVPAQQFDAAESERVRKLEAGMHAEKIIATWKNAFEKFWQTPRTHHERALTRQNLQDTIDRDPAGFINILGDSAAFRAFVVAQFPEHIGNADREVVTEDEDEAKLVPSRYLITPYDVAIDNSDADPANWSLTLSGDIQASWGPQE